MRNLAGDKNCDEYIREELTRAGIEVVEVPRSTSEVPYTLEGRLPGYTFQRYWYYYAVRGRTPLATAKQIYAHPEGLKTVRVAGHCACPPPEQWLRKYPDGDYVERYHIDDQAGLLLFVLAVTHKLVPETER